jgi:hypothetical protein
MFFFKVVAVVTDNAFNIVGAIKILENMAYFTGWRHVPCFAHTLSLIVKGAIEKNGEFFVIHVPELKCFFHSSHENGGEIGLRRNRNGDLGLRFRTKEK